MIEAGTIVEIRGLKSAAGREINGKRAAVIKPVDNGERWQVRVELESKSNATKALKEENLKRLRRLRLPVGPNRGQAMDVDETLVPKLCELLVYYKGAGPDNPRGDFQPSEIMFRGYGSTAFCRMGQYNFMHYVPVQMEQMGGVLGLANICREAEEPGTESVLFGLLEGDPMYVDVFIQQAHWTGYIVEDKPENQDAPVGFHNCPPTALTPDQDSAPYVRTMSEGPVLLLKEMTKYSFGQALWAAMRKSEFYHLLIQRLLRWTAREAKGTSDGRKLGKSARQILIDMLPGIPGLKTLVSEQIADHILANAGSSLTTPHEVTVEEVSRILNGE